jgi:putative heme degradation protein
VIGTLTVGGNEKIAPKVFWAVVRSHDVMEEYKSLNFMDHPSISSEFVKFLTVNTGIDAVDKLVQKVALLEEASKAATKEVKAATTAASTASNKADEAKRQVAALEKRLLKLETKK